MLLRRLSPAELFNPIYPVMLYLFISITTLHEVSPFLLSLHIETLTLIWALFSGLITFIAAERKELNYSNPVLITLILGLLYISAPILTSLFTHDDLKILQDQEYLTLAKMMLFSPVLIMLLKNDDYKKKIMQGVLIFYSFFAFYFLYRYLILHEVRDFDLRPELKIRHGDANFLCTFFSMMIPLALMKAYIEKHKLSLCLLNLSISALFLICTFLTESRMGIIATLISLLYLLFSPLLSLKNKVKVSGFSLLFFVLIMAFNGDRILSRFHSIEDKSNTDRYLTWQNGMKLFSESPIIGVGAHKARYYFYQNTGYPHFQSESKSLEIHNTPLKVAAELGLIGLLLCAPLIVFPFKSALKLEGHERLFLISSLISLSLSFMTIGIIYKDLFVLHLFFISGLALKSGPGLKERRE